jgi:glucuronoarabinoxylan endo-1,4-beta-xylanase
MSRRGSTALLAFVLGACSPTPSEKTGSQTNWLALCSEDSECGELQCLCGLCSSTCSAEAQCSGLADATCITKDDPGAIAVCGGQTPAAGLCLPTCSKQNCESGHCVAGVCEPERTRDLYVSIDTEVRHQTLLGFGGSLNLNEETLVAHPLRQALYDALFLDSGLDMVRLRNRFDDNAGALGAVAEVLEAITDRLGGRPTVLLTEASPPAALKANAQRSCGGDPDTCTLARTNEGDFVYSEFAEHWLASLDAYASVGVVPDYLSIQNNADWSPPEAEAKEACRFLPEEGTASVTFDDGSSASAAFPGYKEALDAVRTALGDTHAGLRFMVPEVGSVEQVSSYVTRLDQAAYDAIAFHLYTTDPTDVDLKSFHDLAALAASTGRPLLQTEMRADGIGTAVLVHYALAEANVSAYLQNDLVVPPPEADLESVALVNLSDTVVQTMDQYHALRHFAHDTDPGWIRVDATIEAAPDAGTVLVSAWLSPTDDELSVILVNPGDLERTVSLALGAAEVKSLKQSNVTRTVFDGVERSAQLGSLGDDSSVTLPAKSIVTVVFTE